MPSTEEPLRCVHRVRKHADAAARLGSLEGGVEHGAVLNAEISLHEGLAHRLGTVLAQEADAPEINPENRQADIRHYVGGGKESPVPAHGKDEVGVRTDVCLGSDFIYFVSGALQVLDKSLDVFVPAKFLLEDKVSYFHDLRLIQLTKITYFRQNSLLLYPINSIYDATECKYQQNSHHP